LPAVVERHEDCHELLSANEVTVSCLDDRHLGTAEGRLNHLADFEGGVVLVEGIAELVAVGEAALGPDAGFEGGAGV
jgi:hypothetical protein